MDLVCVGDVMLDIRVDADALKRGGDVHGRVLLQPGGTSSNAAVWAAWAGASSRVHGRIGDDLPGRTITGALAERGVDVAVTVDPAAPTGTMLVLHEPGERSMVADRGANARLAPGDLPPRIEAGAVLVSGYLLLHPEGHDAAMAALERAEASVGRRRGGVVAPGGGVRRGAVLRGVRLRQRGVRATIRRRARSRDRTERMRPSGSGSATGWRR